MAIDDKLTQAKFLVDSDDRQRSSGAEFATQLLRLIDSIPLLNTIIAPAAEPLKVLLETLQKWRMENVRYLVDILIERVQEIGKELVTVSESHREFIEDDWIKLVLDGFAKAQSVRAKERIKRLGMILSHAYLKAEKKSADLTEEMMRVAMALDDDDVGVLDWLCNSMKSKYNLTIGQVGFEDANDFWGKLEHSQGQSTGPCKLPSGSNMAEVMTRCAKLQAFGLVLQVRQNLSKTFAILPYTPMKRGYDFLEYIARSS